MISDLNLHSIEGYPLFVKSLGWGMTPKILKCQGNTIFRPGEIQKEYLHLPYRPGLIRGFKAITDMIIARNPELKNDFNITTFYPDTGGYGLRSVGQDYPKPTELFFDQRYPVQGLSVDLINGVVQHPAVIQTSTEITLEDWLAKMLEDVESKTTFLHTLIKSINISLGNGFNYYDWHKSPKLTLPVVSDFILRGQIQRLGIVPIITSGFLN